MSIDIFWKWKTCIKYVLPMTNILSKLVLKFTSIPNNN